MKSLKDESKVVFFTLQVKTDLYMSVWFYSGVKSEQQPLINWVK